jgi:hypothetical protein
MRSVWAMLAGGSLALSAARFAVEYFAKRGFGFVLLSSRVHARPHAGRWRLDRFSHLPLLYGHKPLSEQVDLNWSSILRSEK